jgi:HPt (histidine-containing phosphotransfer) domain-containing protein
MKTTEDNYTNNEPPYFNLDELRRISNDDQEFIQQMLEQFVKGAKQCSQDLEEHLHKKDWNAVKSVAHKHIVSYTVLGIDGLAQNLKYIEHNALNNEANEKISEILKTFTKKNDQIIAAINDHLRTMDREKVKEHVYY